MLPLDKQQAMERIIGGDVPETAQSNETVVGVDAVLNMLARDVYNNAVIHGFYEKAPTSADKRELIEYFLSHKLNLVTTEVAEATEEIKSGRYFDVGTVFKEVGEGTKPEGFGIELADIIIRVLDLAAWSGVNIGRAVAMKMEYNATRPHMHGGRL